MAMEIGPILSALGRHRVAALLITLEIALACAVLCNAFFLVSGRMGLMRIDAGIDERSLALLWLDGCDGCSAADVNARALSALRAIPGVRAAGSVNTLPFGPRAGYAGITLDAEGKHFGGVPPFYPFDAGAIEALGLRPVQGSGFTASDFQPFENYLPTDARVWITRALAELTGEFGRNWQLLPAGAFISILVPLVVFFALQRYFVRGLLAGSTKG